MKNNRQKDVGKINYMRTKGTTNVEQICEKYDIDLKKEKKIAKIYIKKKIKKEKQEF